MMSEKPWDKISSKVCSVIGKDQGLEPNPLDFSDIQEKDLDSFRHALGEEMYTNDGSVEFLSYQGDAPFYIMYEVPENQEKDTVRGVLQFSPEVQLSKYKDVIEDSLGTHSFDNLQKINSEESGLDNHLAEFYLTDDNLDDLTDIHHECASLAENVYSDFIDSVESDIEKYGHVDDSVLDRRLYGENGSELSEDEFRYKSAVSDYSSQFPNLVRRGVKDAEELEDIILESLINR